MTSAIEFNVRTALLLDPAVLAAFTDGAVQKIYVDRVDGDPSYPFSLIRPIPGGVQQYTHGGPAGSKHVLQIDVYDDDPVTCAENAQLIYDCLSGYSGVMGDTVVGHVFTKWTSAPWDPAGQHFHKTMEVRIGE